MAQRLLLIPKFRRRAWRTLRFTAAWAVVAAFLSISEFADLAAMAPVGNPWPFFLGHMAKALAGGLLIGGAYIFLLHDRLRKWSFAQAYAVVVLLLFIGVCIADVAVPQPMPGMAGNMALRLAGHLAPWALFMGGTMVLLRLEDHYGNGSVSYLLDNFRKPRQEVRIFMFLDMRSSTTVAEQIGDARYFRLLNDLYADITDPVIYSSGEIYQYVGDEISVSWRLDRGARNDRCIRCFFAIRSKLQKRAEYYHRNYGTAPVFKAGLHVGTVTRGEVGLVRRQSMFSGDVVNTAAHIQASCNKLGVDILLSKELLDALALKSAAYDVRPMGSIPLKGKRAAVELFTVGLAGEGQ